MEDQRLEWLRPKIDYLFEKKEALKMRNQDFNAYIQAGREYRNPRICEKLIEQFNINQYDTNLPKDQYDPNRWKKEPDAYYDSRMYRREADRRDRMRHDSSHGSRDSRKSTSGR